MIDGSDPLPCEAPPTDPELEVGMELHMYARFHHGWGHCACWAGDGLRYSGGFAVLAAPANHQNPDGEERCGAVEESTLRRGR